VNCPTTDQHLEGSTKRTLAENQAMAAQLAYHEAASARLVEAHTAARADAAELRRQLGVAHKTGGAAAGGSSTDAQPSPVADMASGRQVQRTSTHKQIMAAAEYLMHASGNQKAAAWSCFAMHGMLKHADRLLWHAHV
jgi:hypothetical protein